MKRHVSSTCRVDIPYRYLWVDYVYYPARMPPHVGADSPRYGDPGSPARVEILHVYDELRIEIPKDDAWLVKRLYYIGVAIRTKCVLGSRPASVTIHDDRPPVMYDYTESRV